MSHEMVSFHFRAADADGELFSGQLQASSVDEAVRELLTRGFRPLRVDKRPARLDWLYAQISLGSPRLTAAESATFCRELGLLLGSGVQLVDALAVMGATSSPRARFVLFVSAVRHGLQLGRPLSSALAGTRYRLPGDILPVIRAGEEAGTLATALDLLAASYSESDRFRRALVAASAYPVLLLVVAIAVLVLLGLFVTPNLVTLFVSMERLVPAPLAVLDSFGAFIRAGGVSSVLLALGVVATALSVLRRPLARSAERLPLLGPALRWAKVRRFTATFRLQLVSSVPLIVALEAAFAAAAFAGLEPSFGVAIARIRAGAPLVQELDKLRVFPAKVLHPISIGQSTARLVEVLDFLQQDARAQAERQTALLTSILAPVLILIVGCMIAGVVLSVFSALLEINEVGF